MEEREKDIGYEQIERGRHRRPAESDHRIVCHPFCGSSFSSLHGNDGPGASSTTGTRTDGSGSQTNRTETCAADSQPSSAGPGPCTRPKPDSTAVT
jgi:hypothetical protein